MAEESSSAWAPARVGARVKERLSMAESEGLMPADLINAKPVRDQGVLSVRAVAVRRDSEITPLPEITCAASPRSAPGAGLDLRSVRALRSPWMHTWTEGLQKNLIETSRSSHRSDQLPW